MREADAFEIVGMRKMEESPVSARKKGAKMPVISLVILGLIVAGCLILPFVIGKDPSYMDLMNANQAPSRQFLFGTDTMGRDIFTMIWSGGRISLFIGCVSTLISTVIAILFGGLSGIAPQWADTLLMRFTEIFLSIPNLLLVILLQAILGKPNVLSVSLVIGVTSWASIAKVVRTEVRQIRSSDYVTASRCMGGSFFHVLGRHLTPNFPLESRSITSTGTSGISVTSISLTRSFLTFRSRAEAEIFWSSRSFTALSLNECRSF